jgi:CRISPR/Cas system-associated protein Csx1
LLGIYTLSIKGHGTNKPLPKLFSSFFLFPFQYRRVEKEEEEEEEEEENIVIIITGVSLLRIAQRPL